MDWAPFVREFGLPIAMLFLFAGAIGTGLLVAGRSVRDERAIWTSRVEDWKDRALKAEARLETSLPVLGAAAEQLKAAREDLREAANGPARR